MRSTLLLVLLGTLASACQNTDPVTTDENPDLVGEKDAGAPPGIYVLTSVAGDPLPARVVSNEAVEATMLADTMFLNTDGTGAAVTVERVTELRPRNEYTMRAEAPFTYSIAGGRLTAEIPCNDVVVLASCLKPPHYTGAVSSNGLELDYALNFRVPMRYTRVGGPSDVASVTIAPSGVLAVKVGASLQLTARALDARGVALDRKASWMSLIQSAATVSGSGVVRGVTEGRTLITAFVGGRADTVTVHVDR